MAFNINNLPAGWSAGRVGQNRVFRTPDGKQISADEAAKQLLGGGDGGSFTGFGSSDDDVIVNDPLSASSGMTIKRPTMEQPIVDDPNLNMRNGASDGAGQPDGIDNGGGVINPDLPNIFNDSTGELLNPDTPLTESESADIADAMTNNPDLTWNQAYKASKTGENISGNTKVNASYFQNYEEINPRKEINDKIKNFDDTLKLLGSGNIDDVTQKYIKLIAEIEKAGGIKIPTLQSGEQIKYGKNVQQTEGWGYQVGNFLVLTEEAEQLGADYLASKAELTRMRAFIESSSAAQSDDARNLLTQQEMSRLEDSIGDENRRITQLNTLATIDAQGNIQAGLQEDSQEFQNQQRIDREAFDKLERESGQTFSQDERLAIQRYQNAVREDQQAFTASQQVDQQTFTRLENDLSRKLTTSEREAVNAFQATQNEATRNASTIDREDQQRFTAGENELSRTQADTTREDQQRFTEAENRIGRQFSTTEREAIQAFQSTESQLGRDASILNQENQQAFQSGENQLNRTQADIDREDQQSFAADENRRTESFNIRRDELRFEQESKLESARTGIADATSEEGITRAVELANEARSLERTMAMIDVIEQISASGLGRQLSESGLLEQLGDQFGIDMSFLLSGGLSTGGGGGAPVRVTA